MFTLGAGLTLGETVMAYVLQFNDLAGAGDAISLVGGDVLVVGEGVNVGSNTGGAGVLANGAVTINVRGSIYGRAAIKSTFNIEIDTINISKTGTLIGSVSGIAMDGDYYIGNHGEIFGKITGLGLYNGNGAVLN